MTSLIRITALLLMLAVLTGCSNAKDDVYPLVADIQFTDRHILISNGDAFLWEDVTVVINGGYTLHREVLPRGKSSLPLSEFSNHDGRRPDRIYPRVNQVTVYVGKSLDGRNGYYRW